MPEIYDELRKLASTWMAREKPGQTLTATALVHEAYWRLVVSDGSVSWENAGHFFSAVARAMRRILIEVARKKKAIRHGGSVSRVEFQASAIEERLETNGHQVSPIEFEEVLTKFESQYPVKAKLVELRYFAGMSIKESARSLGISESTAKRYWKFSKAWLFAQLQKNSK